MRTRRLHPHHPALWAALLTASLHAPAWAAPSAVWRCEWAGQVTYADQPCSKLLTGPLAVAGTQRSVEAADPRTASQRSEALEVARSQERLLARLQQERRQREREAPRPAGAAIIGLPPDPLARPSVKPPAPPVRPKRPRQQDGPSGART